MGNTTCIWCNCDPRAKLPGDVSPHSTWCPRYAPPHNPTLPEGPAGPDRAAVWNFDEFKRELMKRHPYVKTTADQFPTNNFMGLNIIVDENLPPGTIELRSGEQVVHIINLLT